MQDAIDHAPPSGNKYQTILIKKGLYNEKIRIDSTRHHFKMKGERALK
ncbi:MAG: hypothetical protein IPJ09_07120 [Saprospiraceae bacterium]|nr:hypothetical protein [Saprospiraceae bacterium]